MSGNYFTRELGRILRRSPLSHLGSLAVTTLLFALFNLIWIGSRAADRYYQQLVSSLTMELFFEAEKIDDSLSARIATLENTPGVSSVEVISKDRARERLRDRLGIDYLSEEKRNPLPISALLSFQSGFPTSETMGKLEKEFKSWKEVRDVSYSRLWLNTVESNREIIANALIILLSATLAGAMLNVAVLSALLIRGKSNHLRQLRLLGAGGFRLGAPYLVEGMALATLSASFSWLLLLWAYKRLELPILIQESGPPLNEILILISAAATLGFMGALFAVFRSLGKSREK